MFYETIRNIRGTLAFRLTVWYAAIFATSSVLALVVVYLLVVSVVNDRTNDDFRDDAAEFSAFMAEGGVDRVRDEMRLETAGGEADSTFFRLWSSDGDLVASTDLSVWPGLTGPAPELLRLAPGQQPTLRTFDDLQDGHDVRVIYAALAPGLVLEIGETLEDDEAFINAVLTGFLLTLAVVVVLGGPIGWFMARRALRGVRDITHAASEIAAGSLDRRVQVGSEDDELAQLARTFNSMLDRIERLIASMREMTDNLAHDLRSPLSRIRASAETQLARPAEDVGRQTVVASIVEDSDRLLGMINATLDIAEAQSGLLRINVVELDVVALLQDACELFQPLADDEQILLTTDLPASCRARADRQLLQRIIANLLDNALKYTPAGGQVTLRLSRDAHFVRVAIDDTGTGIPEAALPHIFERFYRCDPSRTENGNGLGLSMALAFARAQGGDIVARSAVRKGSVFTVLVPRPPHAS